MLDPENRRTRIRAARCAQLRKESNSSLEGRFASAFGQNDINREPVGHTITHCLQCAFCLLRFARVKCQPKLAKTIRADLQLPIEGFTRPSTAIVGAKDMILDHSDAQVRCLDHQLAVGDENRKVHDCRLGPMLKALSDWAGVRLVDEVELAVFRRPAGAYQLVLDPTEMKTRHAVFDHRLLIRRQLIRHADACNLDAGIELSEELSLERIFPSELGWLAGHFTGRIDPQFENQLLIECRVLCPVRCHVLLTCLALQDEVTRDWLTPVFDLLAWPPGLGVGVSRTRLEIRPGQRNSSSLSR